ncbi:MAG: pilus assembly protein PilM [Pseudomonadota bacterium]|nr:pilus assembly protein PilM [Pseudomonadota bacterium]
MTLAAFARRWLARAPGHNVAPIGVDFAAERLNLVQASLGGARAQLQAVASIPYPIERAALFEDGVGLRRFVREALRSAPFVGTRVVSTLPPAAMRIVPMTLQLVAGQSEAQAVGKAVRELLGSATAESVVDYYAVRSVDADSSERQVLVAIAPLQAVGDYLDALRSSGLHPVALDIGPSAIARLLAALHMQDYEQAVVMVNVGIDRSFLTVVWGRRLMLDREIDFCERELVDKIAGSLGLSPVLALALLREHGVGAIERRHANDLGAPPDVGQTLREILHPEFSQLAEELNRTQVYVASRTRGSPVTQVYLNGTATRYPNCQQRIAELTGLPVALLDPFAAFDCSQCRSLDRIAGATLALAAGLALRGEQDG